MQTIHESTNVLAVAETANGMRTGGGAIGVIGAAILAFALKSGSAIGTIVGGGALAIGAMLILLPGIATFEFDRGAQRLVVTRRRLWDSRARREEHSLRDVVAIQVDESRSDEGGSSWRVIVRLADGRIIPFTSYRYAVNEREYTSSRTLPINESRSGVWAHRVVARFTRGATYTAWYDPMNPSDAFIVRSHSILAPVFTLIGAVVIVAGFAVGYTALRPGDD